MTQLTSDVTAGPGNPAKTPGRPRARRPAGRGSFSAWAALLVVWLVWGSTYLAIRVADRFIPPFAMAAARYLTAGAVLYLVMWLAGRRRRAAAPLPAGKRSSSRLAQWGGMAVVGTLLLAFGNGGVSYAEQTLASGLGAVLVASVPLWIALGGPGHQRAADTPARLACPRHRAGRDRGPRPAFRERRGASHHRRPRRQRQLGHRLRAGRPDAGASQPAGRQSDGDADPLDRAHLACGGDPRGG